ALERVADLSTTLNRQERTLDLALDNLPGAIASIDSQRDDLVKMLQALAELSDVGTRVIQASKVATIDSLKALAPTLAKLAEAGDDFPRSLELALTYPFPDAIVGRSAQQARDFHMGDYTNLSMQLEVDLRKGLPDPPGLPGGLSLADLLELCAESPLNALCTQLADAELPPLPLPSLGLPSIGLPRPAPGVGAQSINARSAGPDSDLAALLVWGMVQR
ncbi:MAG TPA: mammalian cell entry protein, partial [Nocardioidaceae bacterium]|nr:mammalian cell entry protein [Nocardioidaceae bacterium]